MNVNQSAVKTAVVPSKSHQLTTAANCDASISLNDAFSQPPAVTFERLFLLIIMDILYNRII